MENDENSINNMESYSKQQVRALHINMCSLESLPTEIHEMVTSQNVQLTLDYLHQISENVYNRYLLIKLKWSIKRMKMKIIDPHRNKG